MPHYSARRVLVLTAFSLVCISVVVHAEAGYVNLREVAKSGNLQYRDMSEGDIHAAKLVGNGHEVTLFADLRNMIIDGASVLLTHPVRWENDSLMVPPEAVELIAGRVAGPARAVAPPPALRRVAVREGAYKVVIDPGHGGADGGATGRSGLKEKDVNLDIARKLGAYLESRGVRVIYTRRADVFVELSDRAAIANRANPDLFVAVHANSDERRNLQGEVVIYPDDGPRDGRPGILARAHAAAMSGEVRAESFGAGGPLSRGALLAATCAAFESYRTRAKAAAQSIANSLSPLTGCADYPNASGGVMEDFRGLYVLRETHAPAVLVETDFLSNRVSEQKLWRAHYRSAIAEAIGEGILAFLRNAPGGEGH